MSAVGYKISKKALQDLEQIWQYSAQKWSEDQADTYYLQLLDGIEGIVAFPEKGRPIDHVKKGYRFYPVQAHLIFYRLNSANELLVIRILHKKMNVSDHF